MLWSVKDTSGVRPREPHSQPRPHPSGRRSTWPSVWPLGLTLVGVLACNDLSGLAGTQQLPSGTPNPSVYHTAAGAMALYQSTLTAFQYTNGLNGTTINPTNGAFVDYVLTAGLLTDELQTGAVGGPIVPGGGGVTSDLDARLLPEGQSNATDQLYGELQNIRNDAAEGVGALSAYDDSAPPALRGQLYALHGYAELLLADLFCSGVPLSTLDFTGNYTYSRGDSTDEVYQDAVAQFTTALTLSTDSVRIANLAWVGKGRAFLDLGQYDSAAVAAAHVPDTFVYQFLVDWSNKSGNTQSIFALSNGGVTVADSEGINGLPFISSNDPRSLSQSAKKNQFGVQQYVPVLYGGSSPGIFPITVASGIEARLIQAEAALHDSQVADWLSLLNRARTLAAPTLPVLTDPGTDTGRVTLLFRERAFDLFLTGQRQGDLRRLIRQYHRQNNQVYPTGAYPTGSPIMYGTAVTAPIPQTELLNPLFHGCLSRGA